MAILGPIYLILIFIACFALVHFVKLAAVGFRSLRRKPPENPPENKSEKKPEPVYYIVEKKRSKRSYSSPRQIQFKDK